MEIKKEEKKSKAIKFTLEEDGEVIARASLFLITNDLDDRPYGLLEDVFVVEDHRGKGLGRKIVGIIIEEAREMGCSKVRGTSRMSRVGVHKLYEDIGFLKYGYAFKVEF